MTMAYDEEAALKEPLNGLHHTITITPPSASILIETPEAVNKLDKDGLKPSAYVFPMLPDSATSTPSDSRSICETPDSGDPWAIVVDSHTVGPQWQDLTLKGKVHRVAINSSKVLALMMLLYFFICSLDLLSTGFRLVGSRTVGKFFANSSLLANPMVGLMIGVLVTVLVQSSSTSTSIVVTMVASHIIQVRQAIPIIMGANIGTSITNTIVSLMQSTDRNQFRRSFAAATVHDIFNWLTVIVLLPLEVSCRYLETLTTWMVKGGETTIHQDKTANREFLNKFTKPFTKMIVKIDKKLLEKMATNKTEDPNDRLLIQCCKTGGACVPNCRDSFFGMLGMSDSVTGVVLVIASIVVLCTCLVMLVKLLNSMLTGHIAKLIKRTMNREYVFPYSVLVDYLAIFAGCILTILVQSSSIFTSALTPLAGIGVISLERMYPLTLGSNIGTTTTGILAALAADSSRIQDTVQLALCHLFFNLTGILLFYPIPCMRFPIPIARMLGNVTAKYRWFSVLYLLCMFLVFPFLVFSLSMLGTRVMLAVLLPTMFISALVVAINLIQNYRSAWLPLWLQNWKFLPLWMHSFDPLDRMITSLGGTWFSCCGGECCANGTGSTHLVHRGHDGIRLGHHEGTHQSQLHILGSMYKANSETNFYEKNKSAAEKKKQKLRKTVFKINKSSPSRYYNNNNNGEHVNRLMSLGGGAIGDGTSDEDDDDWAGFNSHTVHNGFDVHRYYPASPIFMHKIEEKPGDDLGDTDL